LAAPRQTAPGVGDRCAIGRVANLLPPAVACAGLRADPAPHL